MDLGIKVMVGTMWAFAVLQIAPTIVYGLMEQGTIPTIEGLGATGTEYLIVFSLMAIGPLVLWRLGRRKQRKEWKEWE